MKKLFVLGLLGMFILSGMILAQEVGIQGSGKDKPKNPPKILELKQLGCKNGYAVIWVKILDRSDNETHFTVHRKDGSGKRHLIGSVSAIDIAGTGKTVGFTDYYASFNVKIHYKATADNGYGSSGWTNDKHTITPKPCETENLPPLCDLIVRVEGNKIYFDGSDSSDPDGRIEKYRWTFGDDGNFSGVKGEHVYQEDGTYIVTLKVVDNDGASSSCVKEITVPVKRPWCEIEAPLLIISQKKHTNDKGKTKSLTLIQLHQKEPNLNGYWIFKIAIYPKKKIMKEFNEEREEYLITLEEMEKLNLATKKRFSGERTKHELELILPMNSLVVIDAEWVCDSCDPEKGEPFGFAFETPKKFIKS